MNGKTVKRVLFSLAALLLTAAVAWACVSYTEEHTFKTEKWIAEPDSRWLIVDDLLNDDTLVGMTEDEVLSLLGTNDNDQGYFVETGQEESRYVYCLGIEQGLLFSDMDNTWLILDFQDGVVSAYSLKMD